MKGGGAGDEAREDRSTRLAACSCAEKDCEARAKAHEERSP